MSKLLVLLSLLLTACSLAPPPLPSPEPAESTATPLPLPAASTAEPHLATIDVDVQVADSDTDDRLVVDEVWLDGRLAYRNVSRFILLLDGEYPADMDGHEIRIKAQGYQEWTTRIRIRTKQDRQLFLPIHLLKTKPQS